IGLGQTAAVIRCVVEIIDAELDCACDRPTLIASASGGHQASIAAASKGDFRQAEVGISHPPVAHFRPPSDLAFLPKQYVRIAHIDIEPTIAGLLSLRPLRK